MMMMMVVPQVWFDNVEWVGIWHPSGTNYNYYNNWSRTVAAIVGSTYCEVPPSNTPTIYNHRIFDWFIDSIQFIHILYTIYRVYIYTYIYMSKHRGTCNRMMIPQNSQGAMSPALAGNELVGPVFIRKLRSDVRTGTVLSFVIMCSCVVYMKAVRWSIYR